MCVPSMKAPCSFLTLFCPSSFLTPSPILKLVSLIIFMKFQLQKWKDLGDHLGHLLHLSFACGKKKKVIPREVESTSKLLNFTIFRNRICISFFQITDFFFQQNNSGHLISKYIFLTLWSKFNICIFRFT